MKDPVVTVDYNNLFVTVIGSAGSVGRVNIDRDNFTLIDAIAQSGDLQLTGLRENVRVIREVGMDKRIAYEVNFCSAEDVYNSPVFYLQQNDVIYIDEAPQLNDEAKKELAHLLIKYLKNGRNISLHRSLLGRRPTSSR